MRKARSKHSYSTSTTDGEYSTQLTFIQALGFALVLPAPHSTATRYMMQACKARRFRYLQSGVALVCPTYICSRTA
eukprot:3434333-Prymnesium_polylepis.1